MCGVKTVPTPMSSHMVHGLHSLRSPSQPIANRIGTQGRETATGPLAVRSHTIKRGTTMGIASFSVGRYARSKGGDILDSSVRTSGAYTTSTSATNLEDAGGDITLASGEVLTIHADEAMRIRFGSVAATASTGHYIPADAQVNFECSEPGTVSIIDVA